MLLVYRREDAEDSSQALGEGWERGQHGAWRPPEILLEGGERIVSK